MPEGPVDGQEPEREDVDGAAEVVEVVGEATAVEGPLAEEPDAPAEPELVDADEFLARIEEAGTIEGRLAVAKAHPIRGIPRPFEVMVAPPREQDFYEKVFELGSRDEDDEVNIDRSFVKALVLACVVKPELSEAALDKLIEANEHQFSALANVCLRTIYDEVGDTVRRIGQLDTGAQERVFTTVRGSTS